MEYSTLNKQRKPEVIEFLNQTIRHPLFNSAIEQIEIVHSTRGLQPAGMMLVGETGLGKTTILEYYKKHNNRLCNHKTELPVLLINIPAAATAKQVLIDAVETLGGQPGARPTEAQLNRMLRKLIEMRCTSLIIFDEFQHLATATSSKTVIQIGNTIKNLMSDTKIPFILAGLPEAKWILNKHGELKRRFSQTIELKPLKINKEEDLRYFATYLKSIQQATNVKSIEFSDNELTTRFWLATGGMLAAISRIVEFAMGAADLKSGITKEDLATGYKLFNPMSTGDDQNPFLMDRKGLSKALGFIK